MIAETIGAIFLMVLVAWIFASLVLPVLALVIAVILCFTMPLLGIPLLAVYTLTRVMRG